MVCASPLYHLLEKNNEALEYNQHFGISALSYVHCHPFWQHICSRFADSDAMVIFLVICALLGLAMFGISREAN